MEKRGLTAYRKIVDEHVVEVLPDGRMVLKLDKVFGHEITTPNALIDMQERGIDVVFDPNRIKTMIDHVNPATDTASAIQGQMVRSWSAKHGIEFLDVGQNGVCHAIIPEKGWILPGEIGIMGDSHTCTHGAFGAFTAGVGTTELENGIITGLLICPPQKVIRVNFVGKLPANVFAKDLILALINKIGVRGATNAVLEFGGNVIDEMSMESRMTITNMAVEAGATSGMMNVDETTVKYLGPALDDIYNEDVSWVQKCNDLMQWNSDPDAEYDQVVEIDVTAMVPVITINYSPGDVVPVSEIEGKAINQVYIGSCTNGRIEDLRIAAAIFRVMRKKVAVRCIIVPATQRIYEMALAEGLLEDFLNAGCFIAGPSCGACLGMSCGVLAPGEVCVSTTNRNFPGRMGKDGMVHLASPAVAALSAMEGCITEPSREICQAIINKVSGGHTPAVSPTGWKNRISSVPDYAKLLANMKSEEPRHFSGRVFYLPADNIDTDQIIPAKYLKITDKGEFGKHCLEDAPIPAADRQKLYQSQIIMAGENFGCGSSREHAPWALESAGIKCVIAPSFARIFYNNMRANRLLCLELPKETIDFLFKERPEQLAINLEEGFLEWDINKGVGFDISDFEKELIHGGSTRAIISLAAALQKAGKI